MSQEEDDEFGLFADNEFVQRNERNDGSSERAFEEFESLDAKIRQAFHQHVDPETGKCHCGYCSRPVRERRVQVERVHFIIEKPEGDKSEWGFVFPDDSDVLASQDMVTFFPSRADREEYVARFVKLGFNAGDALFLAAVMLGTVADCSIGVSTGQDVDDTIELYNSSELSVEEFDEPPAVEDYVSSFSGLMFAFAEEAIQKYQPDLWRAIAGLDIDDD